MAASEIDALPCHQGALRAGRGEHSDHPVIPRDTAETAAGTIRVGEAGRPGTRAALAAQRPLFEDDQIGARVAVEGPREHVDRLARNREGGARRRIERGRSTVQQDADSPRDAVGEDQVGNLVAVEIRGRHALRSGGGAAGPAGRTIRVHCARLAGIGAARAGRVDSGDGGKPTGPAAGAIGAGRARHAVQRATRAEPPREEDGGRLAGAARTIDRRHARPAGVAASQADLSHVASHGAREELQGVAPRVGDHDVESEVAVEVGHHGMGRPETCLQREAVEQPSRRIVDPDSHQPQRRAAPRTAVHDDEVVAARADGADLRSLLDATLRPGGDEEEIVVRCPADPVDPRGRLRLLPGVGIERAVVEPRRHRELVIVRHEIEIGIDVLAGGVQNLALVSDAVAVAVALRRDRVLDRAVDGDLRGVLARVVHETLWRIDRVVRRATRRVVDVRAVVDVVVHSVAVDVLGIEIARGKEHGPQGGLVDGGRPDDVRGILLQRERPVLLVDQHGDRPGLEVGDDEVVVAVLIEIGADEVQGMIDRTRSESQKRRGTRGRNQEEDCAVERGERQGEKTPPRQPIHHLPRSSLMTRMAETQLLDEVARDRTGRIGGSQGKVP